MKIFLKSKVTLNCCRSLLNHELLNNITLSWFEFVCSSIFHQDTFFIIIDLMNFTNHHLLIFLLSDWFEYCLYPLIGFTVLSSIAKFFNDDQKLSLSFYQEFCKTLLFWNQHINFKDHVYASVLIKMKLKRW